MAEETAAATDRVLDVCDDLKLERAHDDLVNAAIARIYEASTVQDIVNQRVGIIMRLIARIIDPSLPDVDPLLQGPQVKGEGIAQDEVDRLLNGDSDEKLS